MVAEDLEAILVVGRIRGALDARDSTAQQTDPTGHRVLNLYVVDPRGGGRRHMAVPAAAFFAVADQDVLERTCHLVSDGPAQAPPGGVH